MKLDEIRKLTEAGKIEAENKRLAKIEENRLKALEKAAKVEQGFQRSLKFNIDYIERKIRARAEKGKSKARIGLGQDDKRARRMAGELVKYFHEFGPKSYVKSVACSNFADLMSELTRVEHNWTEYHRYVSFTW